ncbi:hypothetical protein LTR62_000357 [Meristemomyces frigidus]|uniref:Inositol polyphosphate-related phosphatase domain-containing protein n=1 Tax=Meristemomyces frigidus TaxID=1508187 RepID=A0AAN7THP4_9PEZI|nr:hypothetical protein LTR62_000357 [Meristemomyces frigidus]
MAGEGTRARPPSTSVSTTSSLMQDVPGAFQASVNTSGPDRSDFVSLSQAIHARRSEYVRPKHIRIKVGSWNVAAYKGAEKDVGGWFVQGMGVAEALAGLKVTDQTQVHGENIPQQAGLDDREDVASQEARYHKKQSTLPRNDPGSIPGDSDIGLYVLALQEVVDINSVSEALRPYTDPSVANKWKDAMSASLPPGYSLIAESQLIGMLLLIYASPDVAKDVQSVSTTSVGTGIAGYMGNKGAVTARIVLGDTTRLVFIDSHLSAGTDKGALERRNWDAAQVVARTKFEPIKDSMGLNQSSGEQIGDEDFAFWCGDLNYRLEGIPGDDVRRLLMLHTRNEYDLSQRSARKIESELRSATEAVKHRVEDRLSVYSNGSSTPSSPARSAHDVRSSIDSRTSTDTPPTTIVDELAVSDDPTSLQTTLLSLLPHDELHQQMKLRAAFYDGWREGPINFLPTYKYDAGSVGVFDSSEKKRAPSWCDRILYRTRRDRLTYETKIQEEDDAKRKDDQMRASGLDHAGNDEEILYELYDPEADGVGEEYDEYDEAGENVVVTKEGFEDSIELEYYTAHQRVLSSDHKPLDAVFKLKYDCVIPELKAKVHAEVAKELDKSENEHRPSVTVVVDRHRSDSVASEENSDSDPATFDGVYFGNVRYATARHRYLTIANTGRVSATFSFIERPHGANTSSGLAPKWINLKLADMPSASSSKASQSVTLEPGDTASAELEVRIFDMHTMHALNEGLQELDDILVLRVEGGRDHFIPVKGCWLENTLGKSINRLVKIPEGGIRKLQRQKPGGSSSRSKSVREGGASRERSVSPPQSLQVSSAPRELYKLTTAIEELAGRVVAEWEMTHSSEEVGAYVLAPWQTHPAWPFDQQCWTERNGMQWQDALGEVSNALDCDEPLEQSLPPELPKMQRLYVLANLLMLFLEHMSDGIITASQWTEIKALMTETETSKRKPSLEEQRTAVQDILAQQPSHNISLIFVTSMLERIIAETTPTKRQKDDLVKKPAGTLRRFTGLGKLSAEVAEEESSLLAMARMFAEVVIRSEKVGSEKARIAVARRKAEVLVLFLRRGEGG